MSVEILTLLFFGSLLFFLFIGTPLVFTLGGISVVFLYFTMGPVVTAVLDDTCGNLIQLTSLA